MKKKTYGNYEVSYTPTSRYDPIISMASSIEYLLEFFISINAPEDVISELRDLAAELDIKIVTKEKRK